MLAILLIVAVVMLLAGALMWLWTAKGSRRFQWCMCRRSMHGEAQQGRGRRRAIDLTPVLLMRITVDDSR